MTKKETFSESARPHMGIPVAGCNCLGCSAVRELHEGVALRGSPLETPAHRKWPGEPPHCPSCSCGAPAETNGVASLVVRVCTAYEQGFGQYGRALENPYEALTPESEAWNIGWQEARKRTAEKTGGEQQ